MRWVAVGLAAILTVACDPASGSPPTVTEADEHTTTTSEAAPLETTTTIGTTSTTQIAVPSSSIPDQSTHVEIVGENFHIGGQITNHGGRAEGLLLNSRMVQAVIDITGENRPFRYPDTGVWDPARNTDEFVAAIPSYAAAGLDAVTVNLQGGNPLNAPVQNRPDWEISAYEPDGTLRPDWMDRLDQVLTAADDHGLVVIVGLFYFGQDHRLENRAAVEAATDNVVDWLIAKGHENVLIEICNESNVHYDHEILQPPGVPSLLDRVRERSEGTLPVSASLTGGNLPDEQWIRAVDYILLHGNRQDAASVADMVESLRRSEAFQDSPKPIVFNEDSTNLANMEAAISAGAGWGYYDKGENDYEHGFQAPPVDWTINTEPKRAFFDAVALVAR